MPKISGAQAVVECLKAEGVRAVFGVPGGQTMSILDALYDEPSIRFITTRHECGASCMADAWGRVTGTPGICIATTGPGATNLITGVGGAMRDSSPCIVLTVNNRGKDIGNDDTQDADHVALFQSITKSSVLVGSAERIPHAMRTAFRLALTGCPGPAHIDFTRDAIEDGTVEFNPVLPERYRAMARPQPDAGEIERAAAAMVETPRTVLWAGNGVLLSQASAELMRLAEQLQVPVITTHNGVSAAPTNHPLVYGPRSRFGTRLTKEILAEADLVVALGNSLNAPSTSRWTLKLPSRIIQVDIDPATLARHYPVEIGIVADVRETLFALGNATSKSPVAAGRSVWLEDLAARRTAFQKSIDPTQYALSNPIKPQYIVDRVRHHLPRNGILVSAAGNPGVWTHVMDFYEPRTYLKPVGFGNMGFALPAAIAAKLAKPDLPVATIIGDGDLGMSVAEIETAVREKLPIVIVVMNNSAYANIKQEHEFKYGPRYIGVEFNDVRFDVVAEGFGACSELVVKPEQLDLALTHAFESGKVFLIDVVTDAKDNVWKEPI